MNTNLAGAIGRVMDAWPGLVACALYAVAFDIFAMTMTSVVLVA